MEKASMHVLVLGCSPLTIPLIKSSEIWSEGSRLLVDAVGLSPVVPSFLSFIVLLMWFLDTITTRH